jgi:SAM-dependent methyltransferase
MPNEANWLDAMPEVYDRCLGPALFRPYAEQLAAIAADYHPAAVLELAAGTGIVTAELARNLPAAQLTATDLNPAMVAWGSQRVPGATWLAADAQDLQFADAGFDLVVCQFGVMFFPDRAAAFAETARVLLRQGSFLFAAWDTVATTEFAAALVAVLDDVLPGGAPDFLSRIPHGYHDVSRIEADVAAGGLTLDGIERTVLRGTSPSAWAVAEGYCYGTPLRFALQERGDLDQLATAVADGMLARLGGGPVSSDLGALVVRAHRD